MRIFFFVTLGALVALSLIAQAMKPTREREGRTEIVWTTDPNPAREEQVQIFEAMFPHLMLTIDSNNNDQSKVIVQTTAGIGPDVIDIYSKSQLWTYVQAGILADITDKCMEAGTTPDICWPACRDMMVVDGRQYAFPTNGGPWVIFYNKNLFDRYRVPYPTGDWSWDEFVETARRLTHKRDDGVGYETYGCMGMDWLESIWQNGGDVFSEDLTECILDRPEAIGGIRWYLALQDEYHVAPSPAEEQAMAAAGGWGQGLITLFSAERVAMIRYGRWGLVQWRKSPELRIGVCDLPHNTHRASQYISRVSGLNRNSPYLDQAFSFIEFLASEPYCRQINRSADNLAAVMDYCYTDEFLHNPDHPEEDYNDVFRRVIQHSRVPQVSPYANPFAVDRIINRHIDLMRNGLETPEVGCKAAAAEINRAIAENVAKYPDLRERYLAARARS